MVLFQQNVAALLSLSAKRDRIFGLFLTISRIFVCFWLACGFVDMTEFG